MFAIKDGGGFLNSCEIVTFISAVACAISRNLTDDEMSLLGAVFSQLGDTLATIATHEQICKPDEPDPSSDPKASSSASSTSADNNSDAPDSSSNANTTSNTNVSSTRNTPQTANATSNNPNSASTQNNTSDTNSFSITNPDNDTVFTIDFRVKRNGE